MQLGSLFYIVSLATLTLSADVADVLRSLALIQTQASSLNDALNTFPTLPSISSFSAALSIHTTAVVTVAIMNDTTADVQTVTTPVSVEDATSLLNAVTALTPVVEAALVGVVAKHTAFLGFFGLIPGVAALNPARQDIISLNVSVSALANAMVSVCPTEVVDQATAARTNILQAFATAISGFS